MYQIVVSLVVKSVDVIPELELEVPPYVLSPARPGRAEVPTLPVPSGNTASRTARQAVRGAIVCCTVMYLQAWR